VDDDDLWGEKGYGRTSMKWNSRRWEKVSKSLEKKKKIK